MGLPFSLLSKFGVPGVGSLTTDQIYDKFFKEVKNFEDFHMAFIDLCKLVNDVMPGKHFAAPTRDEIKAIYHEWEDETKDKKAVFTNYVEKNVKIKETDDNAVIIAGMVVPAAATVLKNSAENIPQVKRFKLHLVPNFVFVPTITFLALGSVHLVQFNKKSSSK